MVNTLNLLSSVLLAAIHEQTLFGCSSPTASQVSECCPTGGDCLAGEKTRAKLPRPCKCGWKKMNIWENIKFDLTGQQLNRTEQTVKLNAPKRKSLHQACLHLFKIHIFLRSENFKWVLSGYNKSF